MPLQVSCGTSQGSFERAPSDEFELLERDRAVPVVVDEMAM